MSSSLRVFFWVVAFILPACVAPMAQAEWPAKVFVPYIYLGAGDNAQLTQCDDACGQKHFTLAFIIADKQNNPAWFGRIPMERDHYADQIAAIRKRGGDVIISFGGAGGTELALAERSAEALQAKYQSVIDRYKFDWLDFDIEGKALGNTEANERRNTVLANIQAKNPKLRISYTLPVDPNGISGDSRKLLADAKAKGLKVFSANVMTMYFGPHFAKGKKLSDVSIASARKAYEQCQAIDPNVKIGLTPLIGTTGNKPDAEVFTQDDARALRQWASAQPWVCSLGFWAINRDSGQAGRRGGGWNAGVPHEPWEFTRIFKEFTSSPAGSPAAAMGREKKKRNLLVIGQSKGYQHDSISSAMATLYNIGRSSGQWDATLKTDCTAVTKKPLKWGAKNLNAFDAVAFFTDGDLDMDDSQKADLLSFVKVDGKGFIGIHSATITFTSWPAYGEMIGGYFDGHPWGEFDAPLIVEDAAFPGMKHFAASFTLKDEIYQIKDFSRQNVRVLLRLDAGKIDLSKKGVHRKDKDFAVIWARNYGKGRVLYNGLGHGQGVWDRPDIQKMWLEMVPWSMGVVPGDATPRPKPAEL